MAIIKSLEKALKVLVCFSEAEPELGISDIARKLELNKSNVHDILQTCVKAGYMEQNKATQKYSLSVKMLTFSNIVNRHMGYHYAAYDIMEDLANRVQNIVYFSIPHGLDVLYLYSSFPKEQRQKFPYRPVSGETCPMHCSAMGKAMLAFGNEEWMQELSETQLQMFTDHTITDMDALRRQIADVRRCGYAVDRGEHQYGMGAVGVPILDKQGRLLAAMSICGVQSSFTRENIEQYARLLMEAAYEIRLRLG